MPLSRLYKHIPTYFVLCGVAGDDYGHDFPSLGAAAQAVDAGDVGTLIMYWLHKLLEDGNSQCAKHCISLYLHIIYETAHG